MYIYVIDDSDTALIRITELYRLKFSLIFNGSLKQKLGYSSMNIICVGSILNYLYKSIESFGELYIARTLLG